MSESDRIWKLENRVRDLEGRISSMAKSIPYPTVREAPLTPAYEERQRILNALKSIRIGREYYSQEFVHGFTEAMTIAINIVSTKVV